MSEKSKKFRKQYSYIPLHPMMPTKYSPKKRAELREWEKKILSSKSDETKTEDGR